MDERDPTPPAPPTLIERVAVILSVVGGCLVLAIALLVTISVARRWVFGEGIPGDFEYVQIGTALAVFAFLPVCQAHRGNIIVDTFTGRLPARVRDRIDALWDVVYAALMAVIAWCLAGGTRDMLANQTASMVQQIPIWPVILACTVLCAFLSLVAAWTAVRRWQGRP
jgi:TRAP-type C4-dicarboxylate transport system permease small subunit